MEKDSKQKYGKIPLLGGVPKGWGGSKSKTTFKRKILPYNPILKEIAKKLRKNMTLSEVLLWNELKQKQILGFDFDRQRPIDNYIVDFYCKDLMLAIEIDGSSHHIKDAQIRDEKRQRILESLGVQFLRFDDLEVKKNIAFVVNEIYNYVELNKDKLIGRTNF